MQCHALPAVGIPEAMLLNVIKSKQLATVCSVFELTVGLSEASVYSVLELTVGKTASVCNVMEV